MNRLIKIWLVVSAPLALLGLWILSMNCCSTGHPRPWYDFGGSVDWATVPSWDGSNAIPLSAGSAICIGQNYLASNMPPSTGWTLQNITLVRGRERGEPGPWEYQLVFGPGSNRQYRVELLRVLMNGQVGRMKMK